MKQAIRHTQFAHGITYLRATTRSDLPQMDEMFLTAIKENFLKWDSAYPASEGCSRPTQDGIFLVSTEANLNALSMSDHWFADGTFSSQPVRSAFCDSWPVDARQQLSLCAACVLPDSKPDNSNMAEDLGETDGIMTEFELFLRLSRFLTPAQSSGHVSFTFVRQT
jgi:hypothetical protein